MIPHRNNGTGQANGGRRIPDRRTAALTDAARELLARRSPVSHLLENVMPSQQAGSLEGIAQ
jgi:hypothetical protein